MIRPHLKDELQVRVLPFHAGIVRPAVMGVLARTLPEGSVVVFVKSAAKGLTEGHLEPLRRRYHRIGLDSIDTPVGLIDLDLFDFHIAASIAGEHALRKRLAEAGRAEVPVELLYHHFDPGLADIAIPPDRPFRCGYVGMSINTVIPEAIAPEVDCIEVAYARDFRRALARISTYSLHYGVRRTEPEINWMDREYKPFTKGLTAAACDANILVNRDLNDAVELLGADYPFLLASDDPDEITQGLLRAKEAYGGADWNRALDGMRALKARVTAPALAARMREIIDRVAA